MSRGFEKKRFVSFMCTNSGVLFRAHITKFAFGQSIKKKYLKNPLLANTKGLFFDMILLKIRKGAGVCRKEKGTIQFTPPRGGRLLRAIRNPLLEDFNSRPRAGGDSKNAQPIPRSALGFALFVILARRSDSKPPGKATNQRRSSHIPCADLSGSFCMGRVGAMSSDQERLSRLDG